MQYEVKTAIAGQTICQTVEFVGPTIDRWGDVRKVVIQNLMDLMDQGVRNKLIELGWTPPVAGKVTAQ